MEQVIALIEKLSGVVDANTGVGVTVLGVLLFVVSKAVSNEKAGPVIGKVQKLFDLAGKGLVALGNLCSKLGNILGEAVKSDGLLGKK